MHPHLPTHALLSLTNFRTRSLCSQTRTKHPYPVHRTPPGGLWSPICAGESMVMMMTTTSGTAVGEMKTTTTPPVVRPRIPTSPWPPGGNGKRPPLVSTSTSVPPLHRSPGRGQALGLLLVHPWHIRSPNHRLCGHVPRPRREIRPTRVPRATQELRNGHNHR